MPTNLVIHGKAYDILRALAQIWLPALGALYFSLAGIWGLPSAEQVVGSIVCIDTFLGVILGISSNNFEKTGQAYDGQMVVERGEEGRLVYSLVVDANVDDLPMRDEIRFRVVRNLNPPLS